MPNSTIRLQDIVDEALTFAELVPVLGVGGTADQPARTIANAVLRGILGGFRMPDGRKAGPFPWKWNRLSNVGAFPTISFQQDYATINVTNLAWLEDSPAVDCNNTSTPKPLYWLRTVRMLNRTSAQWAPPAQICWLPNDQLVYGTWGGGVATIFGGLGNPGPGAVYTQPVGLLTNAPANPITQIQDPNGNLLVLTTFGTCGNSTPSFPSAGAATGMTVIDGTCVWTVVNPKARGFRIDPVPGSSNPTYLVQPVVQMRAPAFANLAQTLEPLPDDFRPYFLDGFIAECYRRSREKGVLLKAEKEMLKWMQSLEDACAIEDKEPSAFAFFPVKGAMDYSDFVLDPGAGNPYPRGGF